MNKTLKWLVTKTVSATSRNISVLYFQQYYKEVYKQLLDLCGSEEEAIETAFNLGFFSAQESAQRRDKVMKMFPGDAKKILTYIPLLWEIFFGLPMGDFTSKWDKSDPDRTRLIYILKENPLLFGMGSDPEQDSLPWDKLWSDKFGGYNALVTGLLTQLCSFILEINGKPDRIIINNTQSLMHDDSAFVLECEIIPVTNFPEVKLTSEGNAEPQFTQEGADEEESKEKGGFEKILGPLADLISIEQLEMLFSGSDKLIGELFNSITQKIMHMSGPDFLNHYINFEEDFLRAIGFLAIHLPNEAGRLTEKVFSDEKMARIYGHIFLTIKETATQIISANVVGGLRDFFADAFENLEPSAFVDTFREIPPEKIITLILEGAQKALQDLGVPFKDLKETIYQEVQSFKKDPNASNSADTSDASKDVLIEKLIKNIMLISTSILSIPGQLFLIFLNDMLSTTNDVLMNTLNIVRDAGIELSEVIKDLQKP